MTAPYPGVPYPGAPMSASLSTLPRPHCISKNPVSPSQKSPLLDTPDSFEIVYLRDMMSSKHVQSIEINQQRRWILLHRTKAQSGPITSVGILPRPSKSCTRKIKIKITSNSVYRDLTLYLSFPFLSFPFPFLSFHFLSLPQEENPPNNPTRPKELQFLSFQSQHLF